MTRAYVPTDHEYRFTLQLRVDDPVQLLRRAQAQALAENADPADMLRDGQPNIEACLVMVLDPGSIAGCEIYGSTAQRNDDPVDNLL
jgi:hypothetical protein